MFRQLILSLVIIFLLFHHQDDPDAPCPPSACPFFFFSCFSRMISASLKSKEALSFLIQQQLFNFRNGIFTGLSMVSKSLPVLFLIFFFYDVVDVHNMYTYNHFHEWPIENRLQVIF